jgi:hypothetical protein
MESSCTQHKKVQNIGAMMNRGNSRPAPYAETCGGVASGADI